MCILNLNNLQSQICISYFPFQSVLSISTNTNKRLWLDFKTETNTFASNLNMEISPKVNYKINNYSFYYLGMGSGFNPSRIGTESGWINGYFVDWGIRFKPLKKEQRFQLAFELSPYINKTFSGGNLRTKLGIAWNFNPRVKAGIN